ncbi:MAG: hypothetical protein GY858_05515 [Candidatus Omnitrophica bacterium]|nr:hypothetical protein [Candidatus Omnitrophota bacterium]
MEYKPRVQATRILDRAWIHIQSVDYKVSLRWVFYRLLQDGLYKSKGDYKKLINMLSRARKRRYKEWGPWSLSDVSREPIVRHGEFKDVEEFEEWKDALEPSIDEWYSQDNYVEVWFEAKAMVDQFKELVPNFVTLEPFGGDISIPEKWKIAKRLKKANEEYQLPITILYFGDCDSKGEEIPKNAIKDIRPWSSTDFKFKIAGLTKQQARLKKITEKPENPNEFQWEALNDNQAREIIDNAILPLLKL